MISRSLRTFWAACPPAPVIESMAGFAVELQAACSALGLKVAWLAPQSMHITLKFLGEVAESALPPMLERVRRGLSQLAPWTGAQLLLRGLDAFPNQRRPRVLFAAVQSGGDSADALLSQLGRLQQSLEDWLAELGFPREARPLHPHLTLGRVRDGHEAKEAALASLFQHHGSRRFGAAFPIEALTLYESRLESDGAMYTPLYTLPLNGQAKENVSHGN